MILAAAIVAEVRPPFLTDEACLLVEELSVEAGHLGDYLPLPFPQRPVPTAIGENHITAVIIHYLLCAEARDTAVEQRQETDIVNKLHQFNDGAYTGKESIHFSISQVSH